MTQPSRYTLLEKLGSSVLGSVYKAQDTTTGSVVALKVLQLGLLDDVSSSDMDARLQRDYEAAARLQHPGIARVLEIRRDGATALIASELVEGPSITFLARGPARSDLGQVVVATAQLLEALEFAHNQGVIHRDLKPSNVLIQGTRIKITDFGMADLGARNREDTGALVGEIAYMAPEQFLSGTIDKRCDIHAVGTILYELLTGTSPFRGDPNTVSAMFKVLDFVPPPPSELREGLSPGFDRVVGRALAKSPAQRFMTAYQFRAELIAAYVAVIRRPPPDTLIPVSLTPPQAAGSEAPRTTLVQSRPSPQSPSAVQPELQGVRAQTPPAVQAPPERATPPTPPSAEAPRAGVNPRGPFVPQELVRQAVAVDEVPEAAAPAERAENGQLLPQPDDGDPGRYPAMPSPIEARPPGVSAVAAPPTRAASPPSKSAVPLTDASIAHCGRVLAEFVGPIAMVYSRRAAQDARDERGFIELLAAHLTDPAERARFLRQVRQGHA